MIRFAPLFLSALACLWLVAPEVLNMAPEAPVEETSRVPPPQDYASTAWKERPLFDRSRKPLASAPGVSLPQGVANGPFAERFEVKGFGRSEGQVLAIVMEKASRKTYRVRPGDKIEEWTFAAETDGVVLFQSPAGETQSLTLARLP